MSENSGLLWSAIVVAVIVITVSSAGCASNQSTQSPTPGAPASFLTYTDKSAGIEISYPSDWQLTGSTSGNTIATFQHGNESILFQIQRIPLSYSGATPQSLAPSLISDLQKSGNSSVSLLENHTASLGGMPAYEIVFTLKGPSGQPYKGLITWTVKGNAAYELQFTGISDQYDEQLATAQQMISSFKLI
jgi:hypothetical protein